jgi:hypothetical protein
MKNVNYYKYISHTPASFWKVPLSKLGPETA